MTRAGHAGRDAYGAYISEAALRFGVPETWIRAIIGVESAGRRNATSPAGAMGLMQVMPATYSELRKRYGLGPDAYDPRDNILAGTAYLREMHDRYGAQGFLAAYNAGPGRWEEWLYRRRSLPAETVAYMARLEPVLGGSTALLTTARTHPDPLSWTRSLLFTRTDPSGASDAHVADRAQPHSSFKAAIEVAPQQSETTAHSPSDRPSHPLFAVRRPR